MNHSGHRERMKQRYAQQGLDGFSEETILEMLLYYVIPRKDTAPIARELLNRYGNIMEVMDAPAEVLAQVDGMGLASARFLRLIMDTYRYCFSHRRWEDVVLDTVERYGEYLSPRFYGLQEEVVLLLCLNGRCNPVGCKVVSVGGISSASVPIRRIVEYALEVGAVAVVLAHNHPTGVALPSPQDVLVTQRIATALELVEIELRDHLVVSQEDFVSMAASGTLQKTQLTSDGQQRTADPILRFGPFGR